MVYMSTHIQMSGRQLPDWGFHQLEVVADKNKEQTSAVWNVEEHRYTRRKSLKYNILLLVSFELTDLFIIGKYSEGIYVFNFFHGFRFFS